MNNISPRYTTYILSCILFLSLGLLSGYLSGSGDTSWYAQLQKPSFNPPSWIFAPMWTVLYIIMGIVFVKIKSNRLLVGLFIFQFVLNLLWSFLFFHYHRVDLALIDISLMWASIFIFMTLTIKSPRIFWLFMPYFLWVSFAWVLNFKIFMLN